MTPFFGPVKATVSGTPGSGAITPLTASSGYLAFSAIPSNVILFCRADDASNAWMTFYTLWDGTALSAPVFVDSSSGSQLSLTSAAVISVVPDPNRVQPHIGSGKWQVWSAAIGSTVATVIGMPLATALGTASAPAYAATNYLTRQNRITYTGTAAINSSAGVAYSTASFTRSDTAFMGGFNFFARWGCSQIASGPRLKVGVTGAALSNSAEPSSIINCCMFGKDSTDTNIQFMYNNGSGTATKVDTGMVLTANAFYETSVWCAPGAAKVFYYICRVDTGAIFLGSVTGAKLPVADAGLMWSVIQGTNGTTGTTAAIMDISSVFIQTSF